ncbi:deoxynucleoside kinase [Candidatus Aminicenantes bacterium AC-335-B20]|jgi:deoxyadenosine/deoxycytidine kinase|nr:deoxynucleoside kinase [SCandidatus Aminicenantes bacterium Aminicenantia_JdfR_composite]MCP2596270.1 deoxynucleoside kinase [Candidatus Aminicenantes bacterium AC-335-G13]MCP2597845.1 deoxynucleoside kinase [Candidatus Aminicenantes bacterium AC-335-L06]MCP2599061.1 deoxynucleoside kinase [Candidatus Aminicenantes bacterium AC-335-B20]MCP2605617.1 deoxynucleoside kinase [Candidatus Aminicenantes bacterium AC-335-O07]
MIKFRHIAIEGPIKAGKTKLAKILADRFKGRLILDITDNPYLKDFYEEKEGAAFLAQLVFLVNRYHQQVQLFQRDLFKEIIICDYIFEKDKIYAYQTLTDDELIVYEKIFNILVERIPKPDLVIYLQISNETFIKRVREMGNEIEKNISERYLEDINEAFDYFFFHYKASPLLVIKADNLYLDNEEDVEEIVVQIEQMRRGTQYYVPAKKNRR